MDCGGRYAPVWLRLSLEAGMGMGLGLEGAAKRKR